MRDVPSAAASATDLQTVTAGPVPLDTSLSTTPPPAPPCSAQLLILYNLLATIINAKHHAHNTTFLLIRLQQSQQLPMLHGLSQHPMIMDMIMQMCSIERQMEMEFAIFVTVTAKYALGRIRTSAPAANASTTSGARLLTTARRPAREESMAQD